MPPRWVGGVPAGLPAYARPIGVEAPAFEPFLEGWTFVRWTFVHAQESGRM
jgi:hypothetical protein